MEQPENMLQTVVNYFFLRSKDVHFENGCAFITFFARLSREVSFMTDGVEETQIQTLWVEIEELRQDQATKKEKRMPNCVWRYELSKDVFDSLNQIANNNPKDMYYVTPYHRKSSCQKFTS